MIKKLLFSVTVIIATLILFTGCVSPQESETRELFDTIMFDFSSAETVDLERNTTYVISFEAPDFPDPEVVIFYSTAETIRDSNNHENPKIFSRTQADILGMALDLESYVYENVDYTRLKVGDEQEVKIKSALPPEQAKMLLEESNYIISSKDTENLTLQQDGNNYVFSYTMKKKVYSRYRDDYNLLLLTMDIDPSDTRLFTIESIKFTYILDEDYVIRKSIRESELKVVSEGYTLPVTVRAETQYNSYGKPVRINFPSFSGYTDINE